MSITLGAGWAAKQALVELPAPDPVLERDPLTALLLNLQATLQDLQDHLVPQPPFDVTALLEAQRTLMQPLSADQIGQAVAAAVKIPETVPVDLTPLEAVSEALKALDFRMRGTGGGGSLSPDITDRAGRKLGQVSDVFGSGEILADQAGAGGVLTFSFANGPVSLVWITDTSTQTTAISRADPFGGTPTASQGIPVLNATPTPIACPPTSSVKVYAPASTNLVVYGLRY